MIITIDGPAGAGKSTVARRLAQRLGFRFLDTGAMYRAVALAGARRGVNWANADELAGVAEQVVLGFDGDRVLLDGEDVGDEIRTWEVTAVTRYAADNARVRHRLVDLQRAIGLDQDIVTEGRDQGTLVFPHAECKFFVTASAAERARRRTDDLHRRGLPASFDQVLAAQQQRDAEDAARDYGALAAAPDAIEVITDGLSIDEVVERLATIAVRRGAAAR